MSSRELPASSGVELLALSPSVRDVEIVRLSPPQPTRLKPLTRVTRFEEMSLFVLPPAALTLSGRPRLTPSADPVDLESLPSLKLPAAALESVSTCVLAQTARL
eukprot:TRINITY_DN31154_c0_g1_i1.p2 TRINITY_DN31154_c0_g1~~TRINITY_DN31154_c0_g1_i1.p2  ORF type:complete len:104 (-),score=15.51 TRINITY_DN31154_c0_g1_i1:852-1163(-)